MGPPVAGSDRRPLTWCRCRTPIRRARKHGNRSRLRAESRHFLLPAAIAVLLPGVRGQVLAEEPPAPPAGQHDVVVELGAGVIEAAGLGRRGRPRVLAPWLIFRPAATCPIGPLAVGGADPGTSRSAPILSFVGKRDDRTERRPGRTWPGRWRRWSSVSRRRIAFRSFKASVSARRGFGGHGGIVGESSVVAMLQSGRASARSRPVRS